MEVAVPAVQNILTRFLPAAAISAGLLLATPAADAAKPRKKLPVATIALGDKRVKTTVKAPKPKTRTKPRARAAVTCANTDLAPTATNLPLISAAILCLHN